MTVTYASVQSCSVSLYSPFKQSNHEENNEIHSNHAENNEIHLLREELSNLYKILEMYGIIIPRDK